MDFLVWFGPTFQKLNTLSSKPRGNLYVIQDKNHDKIINELNTRRKLQLLEWYGKVNLDNELEHEVGKFKWLVEQKVISKEECDQKIAQAELLNIENYDLPGERLN